MLCVYKYNLFVNIVLCYVVMTCKIRSTRNHHNMYKYILSYNYDIS